MKNLKRLLIREDGNTVVIVALGLVALLCVVGLVIDGGHLYATKSNLQKVATAAALSGVQEIDESTTIVNKVLDEQNENTSLKNLAIDPGSHTVDVLLKREVPLFFSSVLGLESVPVSARAAATASPLRIGSRAVPFGVDEDLDLIPYHDYNLKLGPSDNDGGPYFGVLGIEGTSNANTYRNLIENGSDTDIFINEIIPKATGNMAGPTDQGIENRLDRDDCPYPDVDYGEDCQRIMLVVVYEDLAHSVKVKGFAYFYLTDSERNGNDHSVKGTFIKKVDIGPENDIREHVVTLIE